MISPGVFHQPHHAGAVSGGYRHDQYSPCSKVADESRRNLLTLGGNHDPVEGSKIREPLFPIRFCHGNLMISRIFQMLLSQLHQLRDALNGEHLAGFSRDLLQDSRVVAGAAADFQNAVPFLNVEQLGHIGNRKGLADGLAPADGKGMIMIGQLPLPGRNKQLPGNCFKGFEHPIVADSLPLEGIKQPAFIRFKHMIIVSHRYLLEKPVLAQMSSL